MSREEKVRAEGPRPADVDSAGDNVTDMATFLQDTLQKIDAVETVLQEFLRGVRVEVSSRLYALRRSQQPDFQEKLRKAKAMIDSPDNSDRIPGEKFMEWAEGIRPRR